MGNTEKNEASINIDELKAFLDENKIECNLVDDGNEYEDTQRRYLVFKFPVARNYEEIRVYENDPNIDSIMKCDFTKFRGISNYEGIWSHELKLIECEIQNSRMPGRFFLERITSILGNERVEQSEDDNGRRIITNVVLLDEPVKVSIGYSSNEFVLLSSYKDGRRLNMEKDFFRYKVTLKIQNVTCRTEDEARKLLEKIFNTIFYQIDILYGLTISLSSRRESRDERYRKMRRISRNNSETKEIKLDYEYDEVPMSLYWFAQSSDYSSIFKYFALYQVLEYYFPIYATINVKSKIQNLVKDPAFNINKDTDVIRLLNVLQFGNSSGYGDEREQLDLTLRNVTNGEDIIQYISEHEHLLEFYKSKDANKLSGTKLRLNDSMGIVDDLAERIYDIRCRIVHNKASEINKKILPMSKEEGYLAYDVELLQFISRKAIIANSRSFTLK